MTIRQINKVPAWEKTLIAIEEADSITHIARKSGIVYATTHKLMHELEDAKLIKLKDYNGRRSAVYLTNKGEKVKELMLLFRKVIKSQSQTL